MGEVDLTYHILCFVMIVVPIHLPKQLVYRCHILTVHSH